MNKRLRLPTFWMVTTMAGAAVADPGVSPAATVRTPWIKICTDLQNAATGRSCRTSAEVLDRIDTTSIATVALVEMAPPARTSLDVTFPLGMQLGYGTRLMIDGASPQRATYADCSATGCTSKYDVDADTIDHLKTGRRMWVQAIDRGGKPVTATLPLHDFAAAYDGPSSDARMAETNRSRFIIWRDDTLKPSFRDPDFQRHKAE